MSKYIKPLPLGEIERIVLWENPGRLTLEKAMAAQAVPPDYGLSGVYYDPDWTLAGHVKVDGRVRSTPKDESGSWGYAWDTGGDMRMVQLPKGGEPYRNYIACKELLTPWDGIDAELTVGKGLQGERGWAALALDGDNLILWATGDGADGMTLPALREELYKLGAETALALDGGQSVKLRTKDGSVYINDRRRPVTQHYIFIWMKKKEDKPVSKKVCLDPGHGVETAGKCAPDKSYYEHEFNLDMAGRLKTLLERHGVEVTLTRTDAHDVDLPGRVRIANGIKDLDLFVSLHSNASGDGKTWTSPDGYGIYTSAAGATAKRNIAAGKLLSRARAAGIKLWDDGLFHSALYVCKNAVAPAVLIEHGFHTNKAETARLKTAAYRAKLAEVDCKGILDYLGVAWVEEAAEEPEGDADRPDKWAEAAWSKATKKGVLDGTRPRDMVTRQELAVVLDSLGQLN